MSSIYALAKSKFIRQNKSAVTAERHFLLFQLVGCLSITSTPLSILNCGRAIDLIWFDLCICLRACEIACINCVACSDSKLCHTQSTLPGERRILPIFHLYGENKTFYRQPIPFPVQRTTHTRFPTKILNPLPHLRSKRFENKILQQAVITPLLPYS